MSSDPLIGRVGGWSWKRRSTHDRGVTPYLIFPKFCERVAAKKIRRTELFFEWTNVSSKRNGSDGMPPCSGYPRGLRRGERGRRSRCSALHPTPADFSSGRARFYSAHGKQFCPIINRAIVGGWCMLLAHFIHPSVMVTR